jgi:hypothetical protein
VTGIFANVKRALTLALRVPTRVPTRKIIPDSLRIQNFS